MPLFDYYNVYVGVTISASSSSIDRNVSTPEPVLGGPVCFLGTGQECCNETMPNIPVYFDIVLGGVRVCVCVVCNTWIFL